MKFIFLLYFIIPYFSFAQNQNEVDSLSYPCYSNGTSIMMFFHSDTSSQDSLTSKLENYKAYLRAYPSYNISKNDSTKNPIHIATHGFFIKDDGTLKENPFIKNTTFFSTDDSLMNNPILMNSEVISQPYTLSKKKYTLETQANRCNYHNWEKYIKTYENKKDYILICFNTDDWESKSAFVIFFYKEILNGHSLKKDLIEKTFIRWKEKYPTIEYKMISF